MDRVADEIIITENGSHDETAELAHEAVRLLNVPAIFLRLPNARDLVEVREEALNRSRFRWIIRADADHVAHTSGPHDIALLRAFLLSYRPTTPVYLDVLQETSYVAPDLEGTSRAVRSMASGLARHVQPPSDVLQARVLHSWPGLKFRRRGKWESVKGHHAFRRRVPVGPFWRHFQIKPKASDFVVRAHRTTWRGSEAYAEANLADYFKLMTGASSADWESSGAAIQAVRAEILPHLVRRTQASVQGDPYWSVQLRVPSWAAALASELSS